MVSFPFGSEASGLVERDPDSWCHRTPSSDCGLGRCVLYGYRGQGHREPPTEGSRHPRAADGPPDAGSDVSPWGFSGFSGSASFQREPKQRRLLIQPSSERMRGTEERVRTSEVHSARLGQGGADVPTAPRASFILSK